MIFKNVRKGRNQSLLARLLVLAVLTSLSLLSFAADNYQVTDLGKLGGVTAEGSAINDSNVIVGFSSGDDFAAHAFAFSDGQMNDLGFLLSDAVPEGNSLGFGLNNNNIAVGYSVETKLNVDGDSVDVRVSTYFDIDNLTINPVPQFDPDRPRESRGIAINDNNIMVGFASIDPPNDVDANGDPQDFVFDRGYFYDINADQMTIVGILEDNDSARVTLRAIHNDGFAVGISGQLQAGQVINSQVFSVNLSDPTTLSKIDIFGGVVQQVSGMNSAKKIVGSARTADNRNVVGYVYDVQTSTSTALGTLNDNFKFSEAFDINDLDQIVGTSQIQSSPSAFHAILYENDTLKDLSKIIGCDTGWILQDARGISNAGIITGTGIFEGERRAYMLTPIAGIAPDCDALNRSGGGSTPLSGLIGLLLLGLYRQKS